MVLVCVVGELLPALGEHGAVHLGLGVRAFFAAEIAAILASMRQAMDTA